MNTHSVLSRCLSICTKCHSITFPQLTTPTAKRSSLIGCVNTEMKESLSSSGNGCMVYPALITLAWTEVWSLVIFFMSVLFPYIFLCLSTYYFNAMPVKWCNQTTYSPMIYLRYHFHMFIYRKPMVFHRGFWVLKKKWNAVKCRESLECKYELSIRTLQICLFLSDFLPSTPQITRQGFYKREQ